MEHNLSIKKRIFYLLYIVVFRFTPEDYRPYSLFFPKLRSWLVRNFASKSAEKIIVKNNADVSPFIEIGFDSELGTRCMIQSNVF